MLEFNMFKEERVMFETCPNVVPIHDKCFAWSNMKQLKKRLCGRLMWSAKAFSLGGQVCPLCDIRARATLLLA